MRIQSVSIRNYKTIESLDISFPFSYTAISGKNDSGKTNLLRAIRAVLGTQRRFGALRHADDVSIGADYPKWKSSDQEGTKTKTISISVTVQITESADAGLYNSIRNNLQLEQLEETFEMTVRRQYSLEVSGGTLSILIGKQSFDGLGAQEVLNKLRTQSVLIYNSTENDDAPFGTGIENILTEVSAEYAEVVETINNNVRKSMAKIAKGEQARIENLLASANSEYRVGLSIPTFNFNSWYYNITLGDGRIEVPLENWGAGTRNRTLILLTLFRARQISESQVSASKLTPVVIIEEPESFLHPSAQAEFGRALQQLSEELNVQVIAATHSPYMLSMTKPEANILFERTVFHGRLRNTVQSETSGEHWMQPFGMALGIDNADFTPWKDAFFSNKQPVLLVEGPSDVAFFEFLKQEQHGTNSLRSEILIYSYGGYGNLCNGAILKFLNNFSQHFVLTFDLDCQEKLAKHLANALFVEGKEFFPIGINEAGKRNIEGLVPTSITAQVYGNNPDIVTQRISGTPTEQESASNTLKRLIFEAFLNSEMPLSEKSARFYPLISAINKLIEPAKRPTNSATKPPAVEKRLPSTLANKTRT